MKKLVLFLTLFSSAAFAAVVDETENPEKWVYHFDELDRVPVPLTELEPTYPHGLLAIGKAGRVVLRIDIDAAGAVSRPTIIESSRTGFLKSALYAIYEWKFSPGLKDGKAVKARAEVTLDFNGSETDVVFTMVKPEPESLKEMNQAYEKRGLSQIPEPIKRVQPVYPRKELRLRLRRKGHASIAFVINEQGKTERLTVDDFSQLEFVMPALEAASQWEFKPGMIDGVPVKTRVRLPFSFSLRR